MSENCDNVNIKMSNKNRKKFIIRDENEIRDEENEIRDEENLSVKNNNEIYDISNMNVSNIYNNTSYKYWVKLINKNNCIIFDKYNKNNYFESVADIILDNEYKENKKKRNTLIRFVPCIENKKFDSKCEWLYLITINNYIVKIGGTRTGLKGRVSSYLCGHHIEERGKSGDCSKTNGYVYNTLYFYLLLNCVVKMYAYKIPENYLNINIFGKNLKIIAQTYHAYETTFLEEYKSNYGQYPILNDNCDPEYKL